MEDASRAEQLRWERVNDKFDLLFSQVDDILGTQIKLEAQYNMTNKVVEQMLRDQEILAKQIENTGQAVAHLTLDSTRRSDREPPSPTDSEASDYNPFHRSRPGTPPPVPHTRQGRGRQQGHDDDHYGFKHTVPKLSFPHFDGSNPRIWKSKCEDYFKLYAVSDTMKATFASLHMDDNVAK